MGRADRAVQVQRNALANAGKNSRRVVSAFIATALAQPDQATAKAQWRLVADQMRPKLPKLATLMDTAETLKISPQHCLHWATIHEQKQNAAEEYRNASNQDRTAARSSSLDPGAFWGMPMEAKPGEESEAAPTEAAPSPASTNPGDPTQLGRGHSDPAHSSTAVASSGPTATTGAASSSGTPDAVPAILQLQQQAETRYAAMRQSAQATVDR